jgi:hypothetical protein
MLYLLANQLLVTEQYNLVGVNNTPLHSILGACFSKVTCPLPQVCVPYNVLIEAGSGYSISLDAEQGVKNALRAGVVAGVLRLQSQGDFSTRQPIKLTVTLPANQLQSVQVHAALLCHVTWCCC